MKKLILTFITTSILLFGTVSQAAPNGKCKIDSKAIIQEMQLDAPTADALEKMLASQRAEMRELKNKSKEPTYEQHKAIEAKREQHKQSMKNLLGEERFDKFDRLVWEQRQNCIATTQ